MICPKCGRRTYKNETVCPKCGADMTGRRSYSAPTPRVQVKKIPEPVAERIPEPDFIPETTSPAETFVEPEVIPVPEPVVEKKAPEAPVFAPPAEVFQPKAPEIHEEPKVDLDQTLTFAAIREKDSSEAAAVREYNRMKAQLRESQSANDGSKVILERLPEGYVYVKMSIDEADRLNKRKNIPKPLLIAVAGAAIVTVFLIILLLLVTGKNSSPLIVGKWQGEIEPLRFGITGIPFSSVDTVWEFEKDGDVIIKPQDSLLAGYDIKGTYALHENGNECTADLDLNFNGEQIDVEILYSVDDSKNDLTISSKISPSYEYVLKKTK